MRLPSTAFAFYVGLGAERSYQRVAAEFGVSRQAVARRAQRDNWQAEVAKAEEVARQKAEAEALESLANMNARHLRICQVILKKGLDALRHSGDLSTMEAVRAIAIGLEKEREIRQSSDDRPIEIFIGGRGN